MLEDLLPVMEKGILDSVGSIPLVFKGMERTVGKGLLEQGRKSQHEYHELTYLRSGRVEFEIDGRRTVVERGGNIVIPPGHTHVTNVLEGNADMVVLYFVFNREGHYRFGSAAAGTEPGEVSGGVLERFLLSTVDAGASGTRSDGHGEEHANEPFLSIRGRTRQDIASIAERILRESREESFAKELMMQLLTVEMLVTLARGLREEWEEGLRKRTGKARELVRIARDYITENFDRDISVADAAGYVFLSQGYFTRAFRDETGMSPMAFLMQVRVARACKLLEQRDMKISGIASLVGFSSPQRFNAAFRKHTGMTPMEYRKTRISGA
ncbi:MAG: AraC family transcriptional regulator [Clostridia bacterium]|nr:AraC family transcriptional regulator [Clostridia bacterium]